MSEPGVVDVALVKHALELALRRLNDADMTHVYACDGLNMGQLLGLAGIEMDKFPADEIHCYDNEEYDDEPTCSDDYDEYA